MSKKQYMISFILLSISFLTACSSDATEDFLPMEGQSLEPYVESGSDEAYVYLEKVPLATDHAYMVVYAMEGYEGDQTEVSCEGHGISLSVEILDSSEQIDEGSLMEELTDTVLEGLTDTAPSVSEIIEGDSCLVREINWQVLEGNVVYPCIAYMKADDLGEGNLLATVITVDNQSTDEESEAVLKEVLDAYGIALE